MSIRPYALRAALFPELHRFEDSSDRSAALDAAKSSVLTEKRRWLLVAAAALAAGLLVAAVILALKFTLGWDVTWLYGLCGLLPIPASVWAVNTAFRRPIQRALRRELVSRGILICVLCGYDLRGNVSGRCPECGAPTGRPSVWPTVTQR